MPAYRNTSWLILVAAIPLLISIGVSLWWQADATASRRLRSLEQVARGAAVLIEDRIRTATEIVAFCARVPAMAAAFEHGTMALGVEACGRLVANRGFAVAFAEVTGGTWTPLSGSDVTDVTRVADTSVLVEAAQRSLALERPAMAGSSVTARSGVAVVATVQAFDLGDGRTAAVAVMGEPSRLMQLLADLSEHTRIAVLDSAQRVVFQTVSDGDGALRAEPIADVSSHATITLPLGRASGWSLQVSCTDATAAVFRPSVYGPALATMLGFLASALAFAAMLQKQRLRAMTLSNRSKSEMMATIAHEIRGPLFRLLSAIRLFRTRRETSPDDTHLVAAEASAQALLQRVDDLLDFARLDVSGVLSITPVAADLRKTVADTLAGFRLNAEQKGLALDMAIDPAIPDRLLFDANRLAQVLTNLVSNGLKYTQAGSVTVTADLVTQDANGATVEFRVRDTGIGIPPDKLPTIFAETWIGGKGGTAGERSIGLGLSITSRILAAMQARDLDLTSTMGVGTEVHFRLVLAVPRDDEDDLSADAKPLAGRRVLLIEDDAIVREIEEARLAGLGADVMAMSHAEQALTAYERARPDMVLVDLNLPGLSGVEAIERLNRISPANTPPIFAVTAGSDTALHARALAAGANWVFRKPVPMDALVTRFAALRQTHR